MTPPKVEVSFEGDEWDEGSSGVKRTKDLWEPMLGRRGAVINL